MARAGRRSRTTRDATKAVAYVRVSTEEQASKDLSIPAQKDSIKEYAARKGLEVARTFVEAGVSGRSDDNRPELKKLLGHVLDPASNVSTVLVYQTSRFMRNVQRARVLKDQLRKRGVRVVAVTQEVSDDPMGQLVEGLFEVIDQYESDVNGMRTSSCMRQAAKQGYYPGGLTPYGFTTRRVELPGSIERSVLVHEPEEAWRVNEIFRIVAKGAGAVTAAREMNRRGLHYRKNSPWTSNLILRVTSDSAAIGKVVWARQTDEPIAIAAPPIVENDLWEQVQHIRRARAASPGRTNSSPLLLAGLVHCMKCGASYQLETSGKLVENGEYRYRYYNCRSACRSGKEVCSGGRIQEKGLDTAVLEHMADKLFTRDRCRELLRTLLEETSSTRRRTDEQRRRMRDELDDVERRIQRWELAFESGEMSPDLGAERIRALRERRAEIQETLAKVKPIRPVPDALFGDEALGRFETQLRALFFAEDRALAKGYLRLLVDRIATDGERVEISARSAAVAGVIEQAQSPLGLASGISPTCGHEWLRR